MSRIVLSLATMALALGAPVGAAVPTLSFEQVEPGMRGVGRTVFAGTEVVTFDVEILGKLPNIGPDQNLILARCSGGPLGETGVLSGMSGSPVFVDDKLIGAVAYSWSFSTEPIAGITPIDEMLDIARLEEGSAARSGTGIADPFALAELAAGAPLAPRLERDLWPSPPRASGALPLAVPLSASGLGAAGLGRVGPLMARAGFEPLQAGSFGAAAPATPRLEPGSPVGIKLVRGDLELTATGTATWIDGDRVLAFGHPLFGLGRVDLPLTGATVELLLPSLMQSSRVAVPLSEVGALRQDRASGVFGLLGARPRMIPVRFQLGRAARAERTYSFDIADDPMLSPLLLYVSLNGILASRERTFGNATVRVREGSVIKIDGGEDVELDNLFAGPTAFDYGTGIPAYILYLLMNNAWSQARVTGVNLILEYDDRPRSATIGRAAIDRYRVRAGESVEATVLLRPFRGREVSVSRTIRIPEETPPGTLTLQFGGALAAGRAEEDREPVLPRDLEQLIRLINQLRRNDRVYIAATRKDDGVLLEGSRLPNLPPSAAIVLSRPESRGNFVRVRRRSVLEEVVETEYAVEGSARIALEVEAP